MQEQKFKATGLTAIITHNNHLANPLNRYSQALKPLTSKRNKTDQDHKDIARIEWEGGLYMHEGIIALPARIIDKAMHNAAKKNKNGVKYREGAMVVEDNIPLSYRNPIIKVKENGEIPNRALDKYYPTMHIQNPMGVGRSLVIRTRPIFYDWTFEFAVMYDESILDKRTIVEIAETAGKLCGFCEDRPRSGRAEIVPI